MTTPTKTYPTMTWENPSLSDSDPELRAVALARDKGLNIVLLPFLSGNWGEGPRTGQHANSIAREGVEMWVDADGDEPVVRARTAKCETVWLHGNPLQIAREFDEMLEAENLEADPG